MTRALCGVALLLAGALGCGKSGASGAPQGGPSSAATTSTAAATGAASAATPVGSARGAGAARGASGWSGSYKAAAGSLYIPADWKNVRWTGADSGAGIGEGAIALQVDATSGRVGGTVDGPLGPAVVDGFASEGKLTAALVRKDPQDRGYTGTLIGSIEGERLAGTMSVSTGEASSIRTADFTLAPSAR